MNISSKNLYKLENIGKKQHTFDCSNNHLTNLIGGPIIVDGNYNANANDLKSLKGVSKKIGQIFTIILNPQLHDVSDIWDSYINIIWINHNENMALLPLLKFKLVFFDLETDIIKKIRGFTQNSSKSNLIACQYMLIENGFENNARWKP